MGRIIFFPLKHFPRWEVMHDLRLIQDEINATRSRIAQEHWNGTSFNKYQIMLRNQQLASRLRDKWQLIQGGKN